MKIQYFGHVGISGGYGRAASDLCMALMRHDVDLEIYPLSTPNGIPQVTEPFLPLATRIRPMRHQLSQDPDVVIVHTLPADCGDVARKARLAMADRVPKTLYIAYTTWEARTTPVSITEGLRSFDQVWVPSYANALAFGASPVGVYVVPHCFDEETLPMRRSTPQPVEKRFTFYYVGAWTARKDPSALVRAYAHAFTKDDNVQLWLHSKDINRDVLAHEMSMTGVPEAAFPKIITSSSRSEAAMLAMHREADCFVTASHGEAWNLPAFDAMLAGRHVIAPSLQGSDDFLRGTSADLYECRKGIPRVDSRSREVTTGHGFQTVGAQGLSSKCIWGEPNLLELVHCMQSVATHKVRDLTVSYDPRERFGYRAVAKRAVELMRSLG